MAAEPYELMLRLAMRLATEAGQIAGENRSKGLVQTKRDGSLVTGADRAAQEHILRAIGTSYPEHAVCAEEDTESAARTRLSAARFTWVVDPVDGTRNYAWGFPCFATSIAVLEAGLPVVAAIREHNLGCMYTATAGGGARRDGEPISASGRIHDFDQLVGFASSKDPLTVAVVQHWAAQDGLILRNTGSTAMQLAWVADGRLSAAFGKRVMLWDVAAGALLIREAGGLITDPWGRDYVPFDVAADADRELPYLAAGRAGHTRMLATVRDAEATSLPNG